MQTIYFLEYDVVVDHWFQEPLESSPILPMVNIARST